MVCVFKASFGVRGYFVEVKVILAVVIYLEAVWWLFIQKLEIHSEVCSSYVRKEASSSRMLSGLEASGLGQNFPKAALAVILW